LLSASFVALGGIYDGLRQPLLAAGRVEWAGVFALTYVCTAQRRGLVYVVLIASFELIKGITGFFAEFKEVFVVILIGVVAASPRVKPRTAMIGLVLAGATLAMGAFWSAIKADYRTYVSEGSWQQSALVPLEDRLDYLAHRVSETDAETMEFGFDILVRRWGYVDLLSATISNVPAKVPYENGALIGASVMHMLQPRLLFPDKPPLASDTDVAIRYSGIGFNEGGNAATTSISLGYVTELYVDFGVVGALAVTFLLGLLLGCAVKYLMASTALPAIVNSGLAIVLAISVASFEEALAKMIGAAVTSFVVILALRSSFLPYLLNLLSMSSPTGAAKRGMELAQGGPIGAGR
jgi:hypothetical protein